MGDLELGSKEAYSEVDEGGEYKSGFSNNEEHSKDSGLADSSMELSINIAKQGLEADDASYTMHTHWERRSRMEDIAPEILDGLPQASESTKVAS